MALSISKLQVVLDCSFTVRASATQSIRKKPLNGLKNMDAEQMKIVATVSDISAIEPTGGLWALLPRKTAYGTLVMP